MNKICTSKEQSKKLLEFGIDINTADMFWDTAEPLERIVPTVGPISAYYDMEDWAIPAWSLSALLDLMPNVNGHYPELCRGKQTGQYYMWIEDTFDTQTFNYPLDAAFEMIVWLKENGKI